MKRSFRIKADDCDGDIKTVVTVKIIARPGTLTTREMNRVKRVAADQFMQSLRQIPHFTPHLCDMKIS